MSLSLFYEEDEIISNNAFHTTLPHQNLVLSYLDPYLPRKSLFLCFSLGTGKTYAAACLAHTFLSEGFSVLFLANSVNSVTNFRYEYNKVIEDNRVPDLYKNVDAMSYSKFYNKTEKQMDYGLIILDEAHNLKDTGLRYENITDKLDAMPGAKILVISATPMFDSVKELPAVLSLAREDKPHVMFSDNISSINSIKIYEGDKVGSNTLFLSKLKGKQLETYIEAENDNDSVFTNLRQASLSCSEMYDPKIPLDEQSAKINKLIGTLQKAPTVVFCFYIKRGITFLTQVLDHLGYENYLNAKSNSSKLKYAVITSSNTTEETADIINAYNDILNLDGSKINILIGSYVLSESITLFCTRHVHILSPHWNFSQIEQAIGRVVRINSHYFAPDKRVSIYLHASYKSLKNGKYIGKDIEMIDISTEKQTAIEDKLRDLKLENVVDYVSQNFSPPIVDNILVFKYKNFIWDFTNCFEKNKYKISWCNVYEHRAEGYRLDTKEKIVGYPPSVFRIAKPVDKGYTIWRSCIDNKLRITKIEDVSNKKMKRGKILKNLSLEEIRQIALDINPNTTNISIEYIISELQSEGKYFDKQIICL